MGQVGTLVIEKLQGLLTASAGISFSLWVMSQESGEAPAEFAMEQVVALHASAELVERARSVAYPALFIYCEKVQNQMKEKFRTFSGSADLVIEVRASHDRLEGMAALLQTYVDAAIMTLDGRRGDWGDGVFFPGGYQVEYGAIRSGGKNFAQTAKICFEVKVSR
jgi:hypothetical protein